MPGKRWGQRVVGGFEMPFYDVFFVLTIVFVTFYSGMVEVFKVRRTEGTWKTIVCTDSEAKCQHEPWACAVSPVEADRKCL